MTPLWHGVELCRTLCLGTTDLGGAAVHVGYLLARAAAGYAAALRTYRGRLHEERARDAAAAAARPPRPVPGPWPDGGRGGARAACPSSSGTPGPTVTCGSC